MQTLAEKETHCDFVDGLRGIAILMVMVNHWAYFVVGPVTTPFFGPSTMRWIGAGNKGVVLFFLVSAFTLFLSTRTRLQREKSPIRNFYLRRAFRILPLWWIAVTAYLLFQAIPLASHLCCYTMTFGFTLAHLHPVIGAWTLFVEELFYLLFPLIFLRVNRPRHAAWLLMGTYVLRLVWFRAAPLSSLIGLAAAPPFFPFAHWYAFAVGICLYFVFQSDSFRKNYLKSLGLAWIADAAAILLSYRFLTEHWGGKDDVTVLSFAAVFIAAASPLSLFGRLTRLPLLQRFGLSCYSIYLFHGLVLLMIKEPIRAWISGSALSSVPLEIIFVVSFPVFAFGMLAFGQLSFMLLERPLVQLGKRLIERLESPRTVSARFPQSTSV